ncbi:MAG: epoxide hydrolase N-terminal domain-containing protein [Deltaproteobacteria bacterium]
MRGLLSIDGIDVHFIHARSRNERATPLLLVHGWVTGNTARKAATGAAASCAGWRQTTRYVSARTATFLPPTAPRRIPCGA